MPADERRAAIVAAALPLLLESGANLTTAQIAEAAGIAEGTIFRVFPTKHDVVWATVGAAFDPTSIQDAIAAIDRSIPLRERLEVAVALLQERTALIGQLMAVIATVPIERRNPPLPAKSRAELDGLAQLFQPDAEALRCDAVMAAQVLRSITFGGTHPLFVTDAGVLSPETIVDLTLGGIGLSGDQTPVPNPVTAATTQSLESQHSDLREGTTC